MVFFGVVLGVVGFIFSVFIIKLEFLYFIYGILLGIGGGFVYFLFLVIFGYYFKRYMGIVNGIVVFGSFMYIIILFIVLLIILELFGIKYMFLILGGMYCMLLLGILIWKFFFYRENNIFDLVLFKESIVEYVDDCCFWMKKYFNVGFFKNWVYLFWFLGFFMLLFGYFVLFVYLVSIFNFFWGKKGYFFCYVIC